MFEFVSAKVEIFNRFVGAGLSLDALLRSGFYTIKWNKQFVCPADSCSQHLDKIHSFLGGCDAGFGLRWFVVDGDRLVDDFMVKLEYV